MLVFDTDTLNFTERNDTDGPATNFTDVTKYYNMLYFITGTDMWTFNPASNISDGDRWKKLTLPTLNKPASFATAAIENVNGKLYINAAGYMYLYEP